MSVVTEGAEEIHLVIAASGPSLLWVQAISPGIKLLRIGNNEVSATAGASNGMAECAIPVYATGPVDVTILLAPSSANGSSWTGSSGGGGGSGRILVTSFYGMGDPVDVAADHSDQATALVSRVESSMEEIKMVPIPPAAPSATVQVALPEKTREAGMSRPMGPAPWTAAQSPSLAPSPVDHPTESNLRELDHAAALAETAVEPLYIPINQLQQSLFFGELISGSLPVSQPRAVETFRVYVPNRLSFAVVVTGDYDFRVISEATAAETYSSGHSQWKRLVVAEPTDGYYVISIRGSGDYSIQVTSP